MQVETKTRQTDQGYVIETTTITTTLMDAFPRWFVISWITFLMAGLCFAIVMVWGG